MQPKQAVTLLQSISFGDTNFYFVVATPQKVFKTSLISKVKVLGL